MNRSSVLAALWLVRHTTNAYSPSQIARHARTTRLLASFSTSVSIDNHVSRLHTLQTLLSRRGAPGSIGCNESNDLIPVDLSSNSPEDTPELIASMDAINNEIFNLHPYLYPIARSQTSGNYICAYRNPHAESSNQPWPIVETKPGAPGMSLLSLNSEHLMRRIVCECDFGETDLDVIDLYNEGIGGNQLVDAALDKAYLHGEVTKLGYGVDKYVLLRVGPFPDLYKRLSYEHAAKGDEKSSLIAAETGSRKLPGFASTFLDYAKLLQSFPQRDEEARDASRMCLRLSLPTIGLSPENFRDVAVIGQIADSGDDLAVAMQKMQAFYNKIKEVERDEEGQQGKSMEQMIIDEADSILDMAALEGKAWSDVRPMLSEKLRTVGFSDMAAFVELPLKL